MCELGRVPGVPLSPTALRVLLYHLSQAPGFDWAYRRTIAAKLDVSTATIKRAHAELRMAGLIAWRLHLARHALRNGFRPGNQLCVIRVELGALARRVGLAVECDPTADDAGARGDVDEVMTSSTGSNLTSSPRTCVLLKQPNPRRQTETADAPAAQVPRKRAGASSDDVDRSAATRRAAARGHKGERAGDVPAEVRELLAEWSDLDLPLPALDRAPNVIACRLADVAESETSAAPLDVLKDAVRGAQAPENLRYLRSPRCKVPFAVVFASLASVLRFAHVGRKRRELAEHAADVERRELAADVEWRELHARQSLAPPQKNSLVAELEAAHKPKFLPPPMSARDIERRRREQIDALQRFHDDEGENAS